MTFTVTKSVGSTGRVFSTIASWEAAGDVNLVTAEKSAAGTFLVAAFVQGEAITFVGSGATGFLLDTDSTGAGTGTYISYGIASGNPAASDVATGGTSGATCVLSSGTPTDTGCVWKGECYNDSEFVITAVITVAGSTTDSTRYKWLSVASGQGIRDHANKSSNALRYNQSNGVGVRTTTNYIQMLNATDANFRTDGLQWHQNQSGTNSETVIRIDTTGTGRVWQTLVQQDNANSTIAIARQGVIIVTNSLFIVRASGNTGLQWPYVNAGSGMFNCTFVRPSDVTAGGTGAWGGSVSNVTAKNNAIFNWTTAFGATFHTNSNFNAANDTSPPGANSLPSLTYTSQFENTTNAAMDFRAKSSGSLDGAGTPDSSNTNDVDIVGRARSTSTPTIGCWEVAAAGGGGRTTKNTRAAPLGVEIGMDWRSGP